MVTASSDFPLYKEAISSEYLAESHLFYLRFYATRGLNYYIDEIGRKWEGQYQGM